jgi:uncharacterized protein YuzB (UPF0349 family)
MNFRLVLPLMGDVIEYCLRNVDGGVRDRLAAVETDAEVVERRCLQRCGECYRGPFLVVDGALETADSHAALLAGHGVSEECP